MKDRGGKSIATPLELNHKLSEDQGDLLNCLTPKAVSETCEASISYLIITRPDITHAVSVVSQFMQSLRFQLYLFPSILAFLQLGKSRLNLLFYGRLSFDLDRRSLSVFG